MPVGTVICFIGAPNTHGPQVREGTGMGSNTRVYTCPSSGTSSTCRLTIPLHCDLQDNWYQIYQIHSLKPINVEPAKKSKVETVTSDPTNHGTPIALGVTFLHSSALRNLVAALRTTMSSSSLPGSGTRTPPPASAPVKSSPVGKVQPYYIQHKRDQVQAFHENVQQLECLTEDQFFKYLRVTEDLFPPDSPRGLSININSFCSLANEIARSIKARREHRLLCIYLFLTHDFSLDFPNDDNLLVFKDAGNKTPNGHVTGTRCRPDITAAFEKDWITDDSTDWALIRLAGERASGGNNFETQKKNAATYLHYLLLARPDFLVA